VHLLVIV